MMRLGTLAFLATVLVGCSGTPTGPNAHTADEAKALADYNSLTPEQQIKRAEDSPVMAPAAKKALIQSIKDKNHLK